MSDLPTYVLERVFDAPRELVWRTWTDAELLPRWYGPRVEKEGAQTRMRFTWVPHEPSEAEIACFASAMSGMDKGWGAGMELLAELVSELQA